MIKKLRFGSKLEIFFEIANNRKKKLCKARILIYIPNSTPLIDASGTRQSFLPGF